jgi:hypothetical protein
MDELSESGSSSGTLLCNVVFFVCGFLGILAGLVVSKLNILYIWKHEVNILSVLTIFI